MGNILVSENSVVRTCCNFSDKGFEEETYETQLKSEHSTKKMKRKDTPHASPKAYEELDGDETNDVNLQRKTSFSFKSVIDQ